MPYFFTALALVFATALIVWTIAALTRPVDTPRNSTPICPARADLSRPRPYDTD